MTKTRDLIAKAKADARLKPVPKAKPDAKEESADSKKKLRPSKEKSLAKLEIKKKAKVEGTIKKKPKRNFKSGMVRRKIVYRSGIWRLIEKPTEAKLLADAKAEGKSIELPVSITWLIICETGNIYIYLKFL